MDVWRSIGLSYSWLSASPRSTCMSPWRLICDCDISSPHQWNRYMLLHAASCSQTCTRLTWSSKFTSAPAPMSLSTTSPWPFDDAQWSGELSLFRNEGEVTNQNTVLKICSSWIKFHGCSWWEHTKTTDTLPLQRWNAQTTHLLRLKESFCLDIIFIQAESRCFGSSTKLEQRRFNLNWAKNSYAHITSHLWNNLPDYVRAAPDIKTFIRMLSKVELTPYLYT